jgi:hypothetical protein
VALVCGVNVTMKVEGNMLWFGVDTAAETGIRSSTGAETVALAGGPRDFAPLDVEGDWEYGLALRLTRRRRRGKPNEATAESAEEDRTEQAPPPAPESESPPADPEAQEIARRLTGE